MSKKLCIGFLLLISASCSKRAAPALPTSSDSATTTRITDDRIRNIPLYSKRTVCQIHGDHLKEAVVLLSTVALRPAKNAILLKGSAWRLGVIAKARDGSVLRVDPGAPLSAGDRLRFEVSTSWTKAHIAIVMLDSAGKVSLLSPSHGGTLPIAGGRRVLLGDAVELDASLGPERIVLVGCPESRPLSEIDAAAVRALTAAQGDPRKVDTLGTGCHEESFWITKVTR